MVSEINNKSVFTVVYCANRHDVGKFVASISDFVDGGSLELTEALIMSEAEAVALKTELENYVRDSGRYSQESIDAMGKLEWGFRVDKIELPEDEEEMPKEAGDRFVYSVQFFAAPLPAKPRQKFFLFSSLAAIFEVFSVEQIGCCLGHLYNLKVPDGCAYAGKCCIIKREPVVSKHQKCR